MDAEQIELLGRKHGVLLPDFATREELVASFAATTSRGGTAVLRCYAALIGLCTRIGRESGADYAAHRFDPLAYGGQVYGWLREQDVSVANIGTVGIRLLNMVVLETFPRKAETDDALGKSPAAAES